MNPFMKYVESLSHDLTERKLYGHTRILRQEAQRDALRQSRRFKGDEILSQIAHGARGAHADSRFSLIFIARPDAPMGVIRRVQDAIAAVFEDHGVPASGALWMTPAEDLHMTLLDVVSCVPRGRVEEVLPVMDVPLVMAHARQGVKCRLEAPMIMVDANAMAISFLPAARDDDPDPRSHLRMRRELWDGCRANGTVPEMRYVAMSAHVTLVRFLRDIVLEPGVMESLLDNLQAIDLSDLTEWQIMKEDIKCVHGQVYYGGGQEIE